MTKDEARADLEALALDVLSPAEKQAMLEYLDSDPELRAEFEAYESAAAELSYLVKPVALPAGERDRVRARLMGRAHGDTGRAHMLRHTPTHTPVQTPILMPFTTHPSPAHVHVPTQWMRRVSPYAALAASVVAVAFAASWYQVAKERDKYVLAYSAAAADRMSGGKVDSLRDAIADKDRMIASLIGPQVAVVSLAANNAPTMTARMFWDQAVNQWTFVAHNLPAPKSGRIYQLWLVTANQKISAGTFTPLANGDAMVRATYALPRSALAAVAVTDEPAAGSAQPTTVPFIVGANSTR